jgi:hypothetical protein
MAEADIGPLDGNSVLTRTGHLRPKGRWRTFGNLGRLKLMLESAHEIVETDPMFRIPRSR